MDMDSVGKSPLSEWEQLYQEYLNSEQDVQAVEQALAAFSLPSQRSNEDLGEQLRVQAEASDQSPASHWPLSPGAASTAASHQRASGPPHTLPAPPQNVALPGTLPASQPRPQEQRQQQRHLPLRSSGGHPGPQAVHLDWSQVRDRAPPVSARHPAPGSYAGSDSGTRSSQPFAGALSSSSVPVHGPGSPGRTGSPGRRAYQLSNSYAVLHTQRAGSPPHMRSYNELRDDMFAALHQGTSPHRLRLAPSPYPQQQHHHPAADLGPYSAPRARQQHSPGRQSMQYPSNQAGTPVRASAPSFHAPQRTPSGRQQPQHQQQQQQASVSRSGSPTGSYSMRPPAASFNAHVPATAPRPSRPPHPAAAGVQRSFSPGPDLRRTSSLRAGSSGRAGSPGPSIGRPRSTSPSASYRRPASAASAGARSSSAASAVRASAPHAAGQRAASPSMGRGPAAAAGGSASHSQAPPARPSSASYDARTLDELYSSKLRQAAMRVGLLQPFGDRDTAGAQLYVPGQDEQGSTTSPADLFISPSVYKELQSSASQSPIRGAVGAAAASGPHGGVPGPAGQGMGQPQSSMRGSSVGSVGSGATIASASASASGSGKGGVRSSVGAMGPPRAPTAQHPPVSRSSGAARGLMTQLGAASTPGSGARRVAVAMPTVEPAFGMEQASSPYALTPGTNTLQASDDEFAALEAAARARVAQLSQQQQQQHHWQQPRPGSPGQHHASASSSAGGASASGAMLASKQQQQQQQQPHSPPRAHPRAPLGSEHLSEQISLGSWSAHTPAPAPTGGSSGGAPPPLPPPSAAAGTTPAASAGGGGGMGGGMDLGSLTGQLDQMDSASLEMLKGYASGFIDGRSSQLPEFSGVRKEVVKEYVLRMVEGAMAKRSQAQARSSSAGNASNAEAADAAVQAALPPPAGPSAASVVAMPLAVPPVVTARPASSGGGGAQSPRSSSAHPAQQASGVQYASLGGLSAYQPHAQSDPASRRSTAASVASAGAGAGAGARGSSPTHHQQQQQQEAQVAGRPPVGPSYAAAAAPASSSSGGGAWPGAGPMGSGGGGGGSAVNSGQLLVSAYDSENATYLIDMSHTASQTSRRPSSTNPMYLGSGMDDMMLRRGSTSSLADVVAASLASPNRQERAQAEQQMQVPHAKEQEHAVSIGAMVTAASASGAGGVNTVLAAAAMAELEERPRSSQPRSSASSVTEAMLNRLLESEGSDEALRASVSRSSSQATLVVTFNGEAWMPEPGTQAPLPASVQEPAARRSASGRAQAAGGSRSQQPGAPGHQAPPLQAGEEGADGGSSDAIHPITIPTGLPPSAAPADAVQAHGPHAPPPGAGMGEGEGLLGLRESEALQVPSMSIGTGPVDPEDIGSDTFELPTSALEEHTHHYQLLHQQQVEHQLHYQLKEEPSIDYAPSSLAPAAAAASSSPRSRSPLSGGNSFGTSTKVPTPKRQHSRPAVVGPGSPPMGLIHRTVATAAGAGAGAAAAGITSPTSGRARKVQALSNSPSLNRRLQGEASPTPARQVPSRSSSLGSAVTAGRSPPAAAAAAAHAGGGVGGGKPSGSPLAAAAAALSPASPTTRAAAASGRSASSPSHRPQSQPQPTSQAQQSQLITTWSDADSQAYVAALSAALTDSRRRTVESPAAASAAASGDYDAVAAAVAAGDEAAADAAEAAAEAEGVAATAAPGAGAGVGDGDGAGVSGANFNDDAARGDAGLRPVEAAAAKIHSLAAGDEAAAAASLAAEPDAADSHASHSQPLPTEMGQQQLLQGVAIGPAAAAAAAAAAAEEGEGQGAGGSGTHDDGEAAAASAAAEPDGEGYGSYYDQMQQAASSAVPSLAEIAAGAMLGGTPDNACHIDPADAGPPPTHLPQPQSQSQPQTQPEPEPEPVPAFSGHSAAAAAAAAMAAGEELVPVQAPRQSAPRGGMAPVPVPAAAEVLMPPQVTPPAAPEHPRPHAQPHTQHEHEPATVAEPLAAAAEAEAEEVAPAPAPAPAPATRAASPPVPAPTPVPAAAAAPAAAAPIREEVIAPAPSPAPPPATIPYDAPPAPAAASAAVAGPHSVDSAADSASGRAQATDPTRDGTVSETGSLDGAASVAGSTASSSTTARTAATSSSANGGAAAAAGGGGASAAEGAGGGGSGKPARKPRDARGIEPILSELRSLKSSLVSEPGDAEKMARMEELLQQLDSYRRGVEKRHGPAHAIATQLRTLHGDMSRWFKTTQSSRPSSAAPAPAAAAAEPPAVPAAAAPAEAPATTASIDAAAGAMPSPPVSPRLLVQRSASVSSTATEATVGLAAQASNGGAPSVRDSVASAGFTFEPLASPNASGGGAPPAGGAGAGAGISMQAPVHPVPRPAAAAVGAGAVHRHHPHSPGHAQQPHNSHPHMQPSASMPAATGNAFAMQGSMGMGMQGGMGGMGGNMGMMSPQQQQQLVGNMSNMPGGQMGGMMSPQQQQLMMLQMQRAQLQQQLAMQQQQQQQGMYMNGGTGINMSQEGQMMGQQGMMSGMGQGMGMGGMGQMGGSMGGGGMANNMGMMPGMQGGMGPMLMQNGGMGMNGMNMGGMGSMGPMAGTGAASSPMAMRDSFASAPGGSMSVRDSFAAPGPSAPSASSQASGPGSPGMVYTQDGKPMSLMEYANHLNSKASGAVSGGGAGGNNSRAAVLFPSPSMPNPSSALRSSQDAGDKKEVGKKTKGLKSALKSLF